MLHILTLLADNQEEWINSTFIAGSLNINSVLVRNELSALRSRNWIESKEGNRGGVKLSVNPDKILLSEVFQLAKGDNTVFSLGKNNPNPKCPIGRQINIHLTDLFIDIDNTIIDKLKTITLSSFKSRF